MGGHWLTMTSKLVLIKSTLSAQPIYQSSLLLAPKAIMDQISKLIRDFFWRGGKGNQSRLHLVNWDTNKRPVIEGGLHIKYLGLVNVAMGGKLLWKLFSNQKHPFSQFFWKKYLKWGTLQNLQLSNTPKGTIIWNLYRKGLDFFTKHLFRIPGNDNKFFYGMIRSKVTIR